LRAQGTLSEDRRHLELTLAAGNRRFEKLAADAPFHVYAPSQYLHNGITNRTRWYAVGAGQSLQNSWLLARFPNSRYHLCVCGPNGFLLELAGNSEDPQIRIRAEQAEDAAPELKLIFTNVHPHRSYRIAITHQAYKIRDQKSALLPGQTASITLDLKRSFRWYDFTLQVEGFERFKRHYAGHLENGQSSFSDPAMGRVLIV
jgi:phospholipase C